MFFCKNFAAIVSIPYFNAVRAFINNLYTYPTSLCFAGSPFRKVDIFYLLIFHHVLAPQSSYFLSAQW